MQVVEARKSTVVDLAAYRLAKTGQRLEQPKPQYCDAADSAAWYHREAVSEERH
ncbi:DUF2735 domain-containing protein [Pararhizobium sp. BT-229]|uniref:DUF2735 domain-containing protein n=1 Tax=Pararhizobium sp. BT-229 TaxID=2986923 RepID=UPI0021F71927|nr:DUF2735 domain-containing protein [Pararhizobium sp. BT-229]MCV9964738.1 DUF2735 domain-containing protein [Pararhizobium sp. BT-229]